MKRQEAERIHWDEAFGGVPASFSARLEQTIDHLEEETPVKKRIACRAVLVAATVLIMVGTALAASGGQEILEFIGRMNWFTPADDVLSQTSYDLGEARSELLRLSVREGLYDGSHVYAVLEVEALDKARYFPALDATAPEALLFDGETAQEYARRVNKQYVDPGVVSMYVENAHGEEGNTAAVINGETLTVWLDWALVGESPDEVSAVAVMDDGEEETCVRFTLPKTEVPTARYEAQRLTGGAFRVLWAERQDSLFYTRFTIAYDAPGEAFLRTDESYYAVENGSFFHWRKDCGALASAAGEVFRISGAEAEERLLGSCPECAPDARIIALSSNPAPDSDTVYYATPRGMYAHTDPECCGMAGAVEYTFARIEAEGKQLCPICAQEEPALESLFVTIFGEDRAVEGTILAGDALSTWSMSAQDAVRMLADGASGHGVPVLIQGGPRPGQKGETAATVTFTVPTEEFPAGDLTLLCQSASGELLALTRLKAPE